MNIFGFKERYLKAQPVIPPELDIDATIFEIFDREQLKKTGLVDEDIELLSTVGLPQDAPPFLNFFAVNVEEQRKYLEGISNADDLFVIGNNSFGEAIVIDKNNREIVYFNYERNNKRIFINSNLPMLALSLCAYAEYFYKGKMQTFHRRAIEIDEAINHKRGFWYGY